MMAINGRAQETTLLCTSGDGHDLRLSLILSGNSERLYIYTFLTKGFMKVLLFVKYPYLRTTQNDGK